MKPNISFLKMWNLCLTVHFNEFLTGFTLSESRGHRSRSVMFLVTSGSVTRSESVVGMTKTIFLWRKASWPRAQYACCWARMPSETRRNWQNETQVCSQVHCGYRIQCSQFGESERQTDTEGYSWPDRYYCGSVVPKELAEPECFSVSLKKFMFTNVLCESP